MLDKFGYNNKKRRDIDGLLPYQSTHMANSAYTYEPGKWVGDEHNQEEEEFNEDGKNWLGEDSIIELMLTNCDYAFVTSYENA